jgi:hypothetical protein
MRKSIQLAVAAAALATLSAGPTFAAELRAVPPNMIGLMLSPTGFEGKIYEPGQVDIGNESWSGYGNKLVLVQRSGFEIKEQFVSNDPNNPDDHEDHRCIVGPKREPMSLDVRLLFALPDYTKPDGKNALLRMGLLGNPKDLGNRVLVLDAATVYFQQVQQQVRGKIRDVCLGYADVEAVYKAVEMNGNGGFTDTLSKAVGTVLADNRSPLFLVGAVASNVKPDPSVVSAIAATQAADKLVEAMATIDRFIKADTTGVRAYIYKMYALQEMAKANKNGQNNLLMMDVSGGQQVLPMQQR